MSKKELQKKYWSNEVTENSRALILEEGVFTWDDPIRIAKSLKKSADESTNRKSSPLQSAISMLNFYINRAGKKLDPKQRTILEKVKTNLHVLFNKEKLKTKSVNK